MVYFLYNQYERLLRTIQYLPEGEFVSRRMLTGELDLSLAKLGGNEDLLHAEVGGGSVKLLKSSQTEEKKVKCIFRV